MESLKQNIGWQLSDIGVELLSNWTEAYVIDLARYLIGTGSVALILFGLCRKFSERRRIQQRRAKPTDVERELRYSLQTIAVYATVALFTMEAIERGWTKLYLDSEAHGTWYLVLSIAMLLIFHDTYFYWIHRLLHLPSLYRRFHRTHHMSVTPTVWAAYSFSVGEAFLMTIFVPLIILVLPVHPIALFTFLAIMILRNAMGHSGVEFHHRGWIDSKLDLFTTVTHHDLHHQKFNGNYGLYFTWWDRLMGTELPEYREEFKRITAGNSTDINSKAAHSTSLNQFRLAVLLGLLFICAGFSEMTIQAQAGTQINPAFSGYWVMPDASALLEIYAVEDADEFRIRIVSVRDPIFTAADAGAPIGASRVDLNNPDTHLQSRPLDGLVIGENFNEDDGRLVDGRLYDPVSGSHYRARMELTDDGLLKVRGYLGISMLGRTMYWHPARPLAERVERMFDGLDTKN